MAMTVNDKIDWSKPYAEICGHPPMPGAKFEQGGVYYRPDGTAVGRVELGMEGGPAEEHEPDLFDQGNDDPGINESVGDVVDLKTRVLELKKTDLTDTEIGERLGITRQKVTKIANS